MATRRSKTEEQPNAGVSHELDATAIQLKRRREELGLSVVELHKATGIARTALHDYEAGRYKPGLTEIRKLCEALQITPNRLIYGRDDVQAPTAIEKVLGVGKDQLRAMKTMGLATLLPQEEQDAIATLVLGLVTSRYPNATIVEAVQRFDLMAGLLNTVSAMSELGPDVQPTQEMVENHIRQVAPDLVSDERAQRVAREKASKKKPAD